jgi:hypothetical protein
MRLDARRERGLEVAVEPGRVAGTDGHVPRRHHTRALQPQRLEVLVVEGVAVLLPETHSHNGRGCRGNRDGQGEQNGEEGERASHTGV